jgi:hypothetical protein
VKQITLSTVRKRAVWIALGALLVASLACGGGGETPTLPPPEPTAEPTAEPEPTEEVVIEPTKEMAPAEEEGSVGAAGEGGGLDIANNSTAAICYLFGSLSTDTEWGPNRLGDYPEGASDIILDGATYSITDVPAGTYDLQVRDCGGNILAEQGGVDITAAGVTWTLSGGSILRFTNNSASDVCGLYFSTADRDEWGSNFMKMFEYLGQDSKVAAYNGYATVGIAPGRYDLYATDCQGRRLFERYGLQVANGATVDWAVP